MAKNKGYTLVEFIIVIAIMAILTGMSFITIGIIRKAKCEAATNTFNNQISNCLIKTKATSNATNGTDKPLCLVVKQRSNGTYVLMTGYVDGGTVVADSAGGTLNPEVDANCDAILPKDIVNIEYTPSGSQGFTGDMVIQFLKSDSSTIYGGGTYKLYRGTTANQELYATIYLDPVSGKHFIK